MTGCVVYKALQSYSAFRVRPLRKIAILLVSALFPALVLANSSLVQLSPSHWGGNHIRMVVQETRVSLEFDCAFGAIAQPLTLDSQGKFLAYGTYSIEPGGPGQEGDPPLSSSPVTYSGWTDHFRMELTIILKEGGRVIGPFTLQVDHPATLEKCY